MVWSSGPLGARDVYGAVEFVERNRRTWVSASDDPDETDRVIRAIAGGDLSEGDFRDWIAARCG
jgi:hypothetical protein